MTPDRRLDQLEPLVADVLQKVDRLIEGQGQLFDMIVRVDQKADLAISKADIAAQKADLAAKGVAELTIITQQQYSELKAGQQKLEAGFQKLEAGQQALETGQQKLEGGLQALQAGQDAILQYLKERLP